MGRSVRAVLILGLMASVAPLYAQRGPAPSMTKADPQSLAMACAPALVTEAPMAPIRVTGGQDVMRRVTHAPGDLVTINAGTDNGIEVGQEYFVRRIQTMSGTRMSPDAPGIVRTAGWIRIWAVDPTMSLATVSHACEAISVGDYLEPFRLPQMPAVSTEPLKPEKDNYGHVVVGADRRQLFGKGDFFVLDRGRAEGVTPGARFVVFRDKLQFQNFLFDLGEAVAVEVGEHSSTLQVTVSRDGVLAGDYVAMRK